MCSVAKAGRPDDPSVKDSHEVATALGADLENGLTPQEAAEKTFGWPVTQMLGQPLSKLAPVRFQGAHAGHMARFGSTGSTSRRMGGPTLVRGQRANGEEFPIEASISQLDSAHGKLFTVILRDMSERVRAADELNALATQAHAIRESEKSRVARELHDELAQSLTALKMDANWVRDRLGDAAPEVTDRINDMLTMLDATVAATRRIAADLRPLLLDDLGLVPAIEWLVHNFIDRTGLDCRLLANEDIELREPHATTVFRIVQEGLVNVAKHANASQGRCADRPRARGCQPECARQSAGVFS